MNLLNYNLPPSGNFMVDSDINEPEDRSKYAARDIYEEFLFDRLEMDRSMIDDLPFQFNYRELENMLRDFERLLIERNKAKEAKNV
mgnify:CR=1 FL=1